MRATLSPSFTSSKMKMMFTLIDECADNFSSYFQDKAKSTDRIEVDMKDIFTRFANDVIATAAFGIKCDSINNKDNEFFKMCGKLLKSSALRSPIKLIILGYFPKLARVSTFRILKIY